MSLSDLLTQDLYSAEYRSNRDKWHAEVARRALLEADHKDTQRLLVRILLEGDLKPWSQGYDFYPPDGLRTMFWIAAGGAEPDGMFDMIRKRYSESEPRCQEVWTGEHVAYRCFTCGISENSCMCVNCFDANDHLNHEYRLYSSTAGGCCDCGDPQAWRESGFCKRHRVPKEKRPSMISHDVTRGSKLACRAVVEHLVWALRRCFFLGKRRPELSGTFGVARCFEWLNEITSVCPELCLAAAEALHEKRDVWSEVPGWGNYCSAFASDMIPDETGTAALLRLGCYLPGPVSFDLGALFLKLLLEPQYKSVFTVDFVRYFKEYLCLLLSGESAEEVAARQRRSSTPGAGAMTLETAMSAADSSGGQQQEGSGAEAEAESGDYEDEEEGPEESGTTRMFTFSPSPMGLHPPRYVPPKGPTVLSNAELSSNAREFMDRIYCQLFHSESIALVYAQPLLSTILPELRGFFVSSLSPTTHQLYMSRVKKGKHFYRRVLSELNLVLQHDSVCLKILESDDLWKCVMDILASTQLMDFQRRRGPLEEHISHPSFHFKTAFGLLFEIEEQLVGPILRTVKSTGETRPDLLPLLVSRLGATRQALKEWTEVSRHERSRYAFCSAHVPLTRFFFRFLDVMKDLTPSRTDLVRAIWSTGQMMEVSEAGGADDDYPPANELLEFIQPCLMVLSFVFQIQENLWVRNGQVMLNTVLWYLKIFSYGTLEADLLACRICLQLSPQHFVDDLFQKAEEVLGTVNAIRVFGSIAQLGPMFSSVRRCAIHCLAARNCSFSELDNQCPPKSSRELETVLRDIADFHDASAHPGGLPAHYTLKPHVWDEVEFGGFYLRWMRVDEENALTRYRRARHKREDESFFPMTQFDDNEIARAVLRSMALQGACTRILTGAGGRNPSQQQQQAMASSSSSSGHDADAKTMCCVLMDAALRLMKRTRASETEEILFPSESFVHVLAGVESVIPRNVYETFAANLHEPSGDVHMASSPLVGSSSGGATASPIIEESMEGTPARAKASSKAARAQQKALKAFAKKQRKFQLEEDESLAGGEEDHSAKKADGAAATTTTAAVASEQEEELPLCALCRKNVAESNECLTLLICKQSSPLLYNLESVAMEGEGRCVARGSSGSSSSTTMMATTTSSTGSRSRAFDAIEHEEQLYMAPRSLMTCLGSLRSKFNSGEYSDSATATMDESEASSWSATLPSSRRSSPPSLLLSAANDDDNVRSINSTRHLLHSCGHLIHQSCLNQYREVVLARSQANQPFEGQGVIKLHLNELFCPVCRRVTNDFLPLLPYKATAAVPRPDLSHVDWLKARLVEYRSTATLPESSTAFDEYAEEVRDFFRRCPTVVPVDGKTAPYFQFDPAGLLVTHLYAASTSGSPPPTIKAIIPSLLDLALRHPQLPSCDAETVDLGADVTEQMLGAWSKFVNERFWGERPGRRRRQSALSVDLSQVLVEWLVTCPELRFATMAKSGGAIVEEGRRALRLMEHFARLQDMFLEELLNHSRLVQEEPSEEAEEERLHVRARANTKQGDAFRALALKKAMEDLDDLTLLHRLSTKERTQLEVNVENVVAGIIEGDARASLRQLIQDHFPRDCLPLLPANAHPQTRLESLRRNASILLGQEVSDLGLRGSETSSEEMTIVGSFVRRVLTTFVKEILELTGGDERSTGYELLAQVFKCSALLPPVLAEPSARHSTFVSLPQDYSALTVSFVARGACCPKCDRPPEYPAICMSCGTLVCCNGSCCAVNGVDELFMHGARCARGAGRGTGVFLLLKTCVVVVLLGEHRHCVWGSLYLDAHDEEDRNLSRGKPLKLNTERLDALEKVHKASSWLMETKVLDYVRG